MFASQQEQTNVGHEQGDGGSSTAALELEPTFTAQDEMRELATLSIKDLVSIQSDLQGITSQLSGLRVDTSDSSNATNGSSTAAASTATTTVTAAAASASDLLARLDEEMSRLPPSQTAAYRRATEEFSHRNLATDEFKMIFLEHEGDDAALAAKRLAKYWEVRLAIFGPDRCFLPMTLTGAMRDEVWNLISRRIYQPLPMTDTAGRFVMFVDLSRQNFAEHSAEQQMMGWWYIVETVLNNADLRRRGIVVVADARNVSRKNQSQKVQHYFNLMEAGFPITYRAIHGCHPSRVQYYLILPVIKYFMPKDLRLRLKLHIGSAEQVLRDLEVYCLPRDRLPAKLGGGAVLDMNKWVMDRMALENSTSQSPLVSTLTFEAGATDGDGPARKRPQIESRQETGLASSSAKTTVTARTEKRRGSKGGNCGRRPDPRMTRAAEAKLADPNMSLYDCLLAGGFVFFGETIADDCVDADGITLKQRRNNLCRRVRVEKLKLEELGVVESADASEGIEEHDDMGSSMFLSQPIASAGNYYSSSDSSTGGLKPSAGIIDISTVGSGGGESKDDKDDDDSFLNDIAALPGICDVDTDAGAFDSVDEDENECVA